MQLTGTLRSWNDDRGFGFIAPTHGGAELFVHISAFPRDGSRPVQGESLAYESGRGQNGKPQAVRVVRQAIGTRSPTRRSAGGTRAGVGSPLRRVFFALLVLAGLAFGYSRFTGPADTGSPASPSTELTRSPWCKVARCLLGSLTSARLAAQLKEELGPRAIHFPLSRFPH